MLDVGYTPSEANARLSNVQASKQLQPNGGNRCPGVRSRHLKAPLGWKMASSDKCRMATFAAGDREL